MMLAKVKDKCQDCGENFLRVFMSRRGRCQTCEFYAKRLLAIKREKPMTATPPPRLILDKARSIESLDLPSLEGQRAELRIAPKSVLQVEIADAFQQAKIDLERQAAATLGLNPDVFEKTQPFQSVERLRKFFNGEFQSTEPPTKPTSKPASRLAGPRKKRRFNFDEA